MVSVLYINGWIHSFLLKTHVFRLVMYGTNNSISHRPVAVAVYMIPKERGLFRSFRILWRYCRWEIQDPKLEVPTMYKAYIRPKFQGISQQNMINSHWYCSIFQAIFCTSNQWLPEMAIDLLRHFQVTERRRWYHPPDSSTLLGDA